MPIQPWFKGQTSPAWKITLNVPTNPNAPDLTGLTVGALALVVVDVLTNSSTNGLGSFTQIVSFKNPAIVVYQPNASDLFVLNAKAYRLYVQITYANGPDIIGPYQFTTSPL